jgi:hypothetical protein
MSTESPSTTDRLAEARARYEATSTRDTGDEVAFIEAMRVAVAYKDLLATAPADIGFLLSLVDSLQERLDTAEGRLSKTEQECDDLAIQRNHLKNRLEDLGVIVDDED